MAKANFNPEDFVGELFGVFKVLKYAGERYTERSNGKQQKYHTYDVQCTLCGEVTMVRRSQLKRMAEQERCNKCFYHREVRRPWKEANPEDMIGQVLNGYEILELVDKVPFVGSKKRYKYYYNCKCVDCGGISKHERAVLKNQDNKESEHNCPYCGVPKRIEMMRSKIDYGKAREGLLKTNEYKRRTIKEPAEHNVTTGVRHYSITSQEVERQGYVAVYYRHIIAVCVGGKSYKVADRSLGPSVDADMKLLAEEVNEIVLQGGEKFLEWYKEYKGWRKTDEVQN